MAEPVQLDLFAVLEPPPVDLWLRRIDPAKNMNRFYAVSVDRDLLGNLLLTRRWGRIGRAGQSRSIVAASIAVATKEIRRIAAAKVRRGYEVIRSHDPLERARAEGYSTRAPELCTTIRLTEQGLRVGA